MTWSCRLRSGILHIPPCHANCYPNTPTRSAYQMNIRRLDSNCSTGNPKLEAKELLLVKMCIMLEV